MPPVVDMDDIRKVREQAAAEKPDQWKGQRPKTVNDILKLLETTDDEDVRHMAHSALFDRVMMLVASFDWEMFLAALEEGRLADGLTRAERKKLERMRLAATKVHEALLIAQGKA